MKGRWAFVSPWAVLGLFTFLLFSACGRHNDTPASQDPQEIALVRMEPGDGESSVSRNRSVLMIFNTTVLPESVHDQSIRIRTGGTFQTRPEGSFLISGNVVEFDPTVTTAGGANAAGFPAGQQILVEIPLKVPGDNEPNVNFIQNIEGNPITVASGDNILTFTTGAGWDDPVPGPPGILGLEFTPGPSAVGQVPSGAAVTLIFSEPIDPGSFTLGKNIFLTNNTSTSGPTVFQQDIPSVTFFDGSLTRYTLQPVFGYGQGPFNILVNFIDPDRPDTFDPFNLPTDLEGNRVQNFTFFQTFDTQFDPTALTPGLLKEDFTNQNQRDATFTDALWGNDSEFPFTLVGQPITKRNANANINAFANLSGGQTPIDNAPFAGTDGNGMNLNPGEEDYCPTQNPLVGSDSIINVGNPPSSAGRRQLNVYRQAELGPNGSIIRAAWGPDSDATFAATYPNVIVRLGHKKAGTSLANGGMFMNFDVDGFVTVVNQKAYTVPQAFDINGGGTNTDGYLDWPAFDTFFEYDGNNDLIIDIEAQEGNTFQTFRTFLALGVLAGFGSCSCTSFAACNLTNNSIGQRQMDSTYGGDFADPAPIPATVANPGPFVHVMQFELAKLRSDAQSLYYDSFSSDPDYLTPLVNPLVQDGGAVIEITWSGSMDGIVEDVPFTPNLDDLDGIRYVRFHVVMRANLFTGGRPRIDLLEIPFLIP